MANKKKEVDSLKITDPEVRKRSYATIKTSYGGKLEDMWLYFTMPGNENFELKTNGKSITVTLDNLQEYIDLAIEAMLHDSIKIQVNAFRKGFNSIFPVDTLKVFSTHELEEMICGTDSNEEWKSIDSLSECIHPAHGFTINSVPVQNLLKMLVGFDNDERR